MRSDLGHLMQSVTPNDIAGMDFSSRRILVSGANEEAMDSGYRRSLTILDSSISVEPSTHSNKRGALIDSRATETTNVVARYYAPCGEVSDSNGRGTAMAA